MNLVLKIGRQILEVQIIWQCGYQIMSEDSKFLPYECKLVS